MKTNDTCVHRCMYLGRFQNRSDDLNNAIGIIAGVIIALNHQNDF